MLSFSVPAGMTVEQVLQAMNPQPVPPLPLQQDMPKRARVKGGRFKADDPATPDADEAWEAES
jgi:hypothetical protein